MSQCDQVLDSFTAYMDGELSEDKKRQIEAHLQVCISCRARFESLQTMCTALHKLPRPKPSPGFDAALRYRIRREMAAPRSRFSITPLAERLRVPAYAFAALLLVFLGAQLQKAAMNKELRQAIALNEALLNNAAAGTRFVVAEIDTAEKRVRLINYLNGRTVPMPMVVVSNAQLDAKQQAPLPDLRNAPSSGRQSLTVPQTRRPGGRIIQVSQYQF